MSPLQSYKGQIVRDSKTGKRYEVLGLGRRPGTLRLRDIQDNQIWFNANANWYEPTGASVEDVSLPGDEDDAYGVDEDRQGFLDGDDVP